MNTKNAKVIVCIPAYNEKDTIADIVFGARKFATDVVVCDDGSVDGTDVIAQETGAFVVRHSKNMGYGAAIQTLFEAARERNADVIVTLDSDGQHDPKLISKVIKPIINDGFDITIGSRFLSASDIEHVPILRGMGIRFITKLTRSLSYGNLTDAQSGFRAYSKRALSKMELSENGMSISTEILIKARQNSLTITEVPIAVKYDRLHTSTHNLLSHGMNLLYSIMQFVVIKHPLLFIGLPGIVLLVLAAIFMSQALELFSAKRYVSTPLILLSTSSAIIGMMMIVTSTLIYAIKALIRKRVF